MNKKNKYFIRFFLLFIFVACIVSCNKKWKKPTDVYFAFQLNSNSNNGIVKFNAASINLDKIYFNGERSQGVKSVQLSQSITNQLIHIDTNPNSTGITFNIPQGTYSKIEIDLSIITNQNEPALNVYGTYIDTLDNDTSAIVFQLLDQQIINLIANQSGGATQISLVAGNPVTVNIILNPNYWFELITPALLENSNLQDVNGVETIFINANENVNLYNLILNRINTNNEAVFK